MSRCDAGERGAAIDSRGSIAKVSEAEDAGPLWRDHAGSARDGSENAARCRVWRRDTRGRVDLCGTAAWRLAGAFSHESGSREGQAAALSMALNAECWLTLVMMAVGNLSGHVVAPCDAELRRMRRGHEHQNERENDSTRHGNARQPSEKQQATSGARANRDGRPKTALLQRVSCS